MIVGDACARDSIEAHLGDAPSAHELSIEIRRRGDGLIARVSVHTRNGGARQRELSAPSCDELGRALSLVVAMIRAQPVTHDPPATAPVIAAYDDESPYALDEGAANRGLAPRPTLSIAAGAAVDNRATPALMAGLQLRTVRLVVGVEVELGANQDVSIAQGHVSVARGGATLVPCGRVGVLDLCAVGRLGWTSGRGYDLMEVRRARTLFGALGAGARWERGLTRSLSLRASLEVHGILTKNRFFVDDVVVWSSRPVEGRFGLAMLASFW